MRRFTVLSLVPTFAFLFLFGAPQAFSDGTNMHQGEMAPTPIPDKTYKCEVVDVNCYVNKGAKGEAHQGCAAKCISEGGELALLYDNKLYIPVDAQFHSARKQFVSNGGEMVTVKGHIISKGGLNYLQLAK